jgi:hypothetical protein
LKLKYGAQKAREVSKLVNCQDTDTLRHIKVTYGVKNFIRSKLENTSRIGEEMLFNYFEYIREI